MARCSTGGRLAGAAAMPMLTAARTRAAAAILPTIRRSARRAGVSASATKAPAKLPPMQLRITVIEVGAGADDDEYQEEITKLQAHLTEGADKGWRIEAYSTVAARAGVVQHNIIWRKD